MIKAHKIRLNPTPEQANYFRRAVRDFADDDVLLNTGVSFPISFRRAEIHGVEVKLEAPRWGPFSGYLAYSNTIGIGQFPLSGGLFLNNDNVALLSSTERFRISQDIRNTARGMIRSGRARRSSTRRGVSCACGRTRGPESGRCQVGMWSGGSRRWRP